MRLRQKMILFYQNIKGIGIYITIMVMLSFPLKANKFVMSDVD